MSWEETVAEVGAIDFLEVCVRALERQEGRLRNAKPPEATGMDSFYDLAPDVWFAVVALHRSFRALTLAKKALKRDTAKTKQLNALARPDHQAIKDARDIYEHCDDYFQLKGKLQSGVARPEHLLPGVAIPHGVTGITGVIITTGLGRKSVDVFAAIQVMLPTVKRALELLKT